MATEIILCPSLLEVNYQTTIVHAVSGLTFDNPEWPPSRRWKRCLAQMAVFKFGKRTLDKEVRQVIKDFGYMPGDLWCLSALLKNWSYIKEEGFPLNSPACIVAPATKIKGLGGAPFTFIWEGGGETVFFSAEKDWAGYWLSRWRFLAVRWRGISADDFWTPEYRPECMTIEDSRVIFSDYPA
jgi:hypothetical protein